MTNATACARYYKRHKEKCKKQQAEYRKRTKEERRLYNAKYYKEHNGQCKKQQAEYRVKAKEDKRRYNSLYYKRNRKTLKESTAQYQAAHPEQCKGYRQKRRTAKTQAGGSFTSAEWTALCEKYHKRCLCCDKRRKLTADHVIPVSKGGTSDISNIQPLCQPCNSSKGAKIIDYR